MTGTTEELGQLLGPCPSAWLESYPISRRVNSPAMKGQSC
jgi:hypothetical protein